MPTIEAFRKLPLSKRKNIFAKWVKNQPKDKHYSYMSNKDCPISQFGRALLRKRNKIWAAAFGFGHTSAPISESYGVVHDKEFYTYVGDYSLWWDIIRHNTFSELAKDL